MAHDSYQVAVRRSWNFADSGLENLPEGTFFLDVEPNGSTHFDLVKGIAKKLWTDYGGFSEQVLARQMANEAWRLLCSRIHLHRKNGDDLDLKLLQNLPSPSKSLVFHVLLEKEPSNIVEGWSALPALQEHPEVIQRLKEACTAAGGISMEPSPTVAPTLELTPHWGWIVRCLDDFLHRASGRLELHYLEAVSESLASNSLRQVVELLKQREEEDTRDAESQQQGALSVDETLTAWRTFGGAKPLAEFVENIQQAVRRGGGRDAGDLQRGAQLITELVSLIDHALKNNGARGAEEVRSRSNIIRWHLEEKDRATGDCIQDLASLVERLKKKLPV